MRIETQITRKDYANFSFYYFYKNSFKGSFCLIFLLTLVFWFDHFKQPINWGVLIIGMTFTAALLTILLVTWVFLSYKNHSKTLQDDGWVLGKSTYTITSDGWVEERSLSTNSFKWEAIKSVEQNKNAIFIFVDTFIVFIFPKRCFENDARIKEFMDLISANLQK